MEIARQRRGLTKKTLAERAGVIPRSLQHYVTSRRIPEPAVVSRIAQALDFPESFFFGPDLGLPSASGTSYRALSRATSRHRMQAEAVGALGMLFGCWLEERLTLPPCNMPKYETDDPELAAQSLRAEWRLGVMSIRSMVALLEQHGTRVFALAADTEALDAFSFWHGATPYVFLDTRRSAERTRMDVAHELGHLVLHAKGGASGRQAEHEAERFAGAFLMPKDSVTANFHSARSASLKQFIAHKKQWNVSLTSLIVRVKELDYITEFRYRSLFIEASRLGYRKNEPEPCQPDTSLVLNRVFSLQQQDSESIRTVAQDLKVYPAEIYDLVQGLLPGPVSM